MKIYVLTLLLCQMSLFYSDLNTPAEKVAAALCNCAKYHDIDKYATILKSKSNEQIDENYAKMFKLERTLKACARNNAKIEKEDNPTERDIYKGLEIQCSNVFYFMKTFKDLRKKKEKEALND